MSHDRVFLDNIVTSTLAFDGGGRVTEYVGGYEDYVRQSKAGIREAGSGIRELDVVNRESRTASRDVNVANRESRTASRDGNVANRESRTASVMGTSRTANRGTASRGSTPERKLTFNEARELESLPARIEVLETEQARLQAEAASPDFYKEPADHIRGVLARIEAIGPELDVVVARWVELDERS